MPKPTLYFAYGSNLNLDQMGRRCPDAIPCETATLASHRLVFRRVADIEPRKGCRVHGALFEITPACERALDRYEGYPWAYGKRLVRVRLPSGQRVSAITYFQHADGYEAPIWEYYETIAEGFGDWELPMAYLKSALLHSDAEGDGRRRWYTRPAKRIAKPARKPTQAAFWPECAPVVPIRPGASTAHSANGNGYVDSYASRRYKKWLDARREYEKRKEG